MTDKLTLHNKLDLLSKELSGFKTDAGERLARLEVNTEGALNRLDKVNGRIYKGEEDRDKIKKQMADLSEKYDGRLGDVELKSALLKQKFWFLILILTGAVSLLGTGIEMVVRSWL